MNKAFIKSHQKTNGDTFPRNTYFFRFFKLHLFARDSFVKTLGKLPPCHTKEI
jgi:hypothetical protein